MFICFCRFLYSIRNSCNIIKCMNSYIRAGNICFICTCILWCDIHSFVQHQTLIPLHQISEWCLYIRHRDCRNFLSEAFLTDLSPYTVKALNPSENTEHMKSISI